MKKTFIALSAIAALGIASQADARNFPREDSNTSNDIKANSSTNETRGNASIRSTGTGMKYGIENRADVDDRRGQANNYDNDRYYEPSAGYYGRYGYGHRSYSGMFGTRKDSIYNDRYYVTGRNYGLYEHPPMGNAPGLATGDDTRR